MFRPGPRGGEGVDVQTWSQGRVDVQTLVPGGEGVDVQTLVRGGGGGCSDLVPEGGRG